MEVNETLAGGGPSAPRVAVFDLDGTLADTSADLIAAANAALAEAGAVARLDPRRDAAIAFAGGRAMLRAALADAGPEEIDRLYPRLLAAYGGAIMVETRLYDGVVEALDRLEARGWVLAVRTNKPAGFAATLLAALGLGDRLAAMLGADSLAVRKPDPLHLTETIARAGGHPARAVLVGDTITDARAAAAAGVPCVLVGFGPEGDAVAGHGPAAILAHYRDLPDLLDRLVPA